MRLLQTWQINPVRPLACLALRCEESPSPNLGDSAVQHPVGVHGRIGVRGPLGPNGAQIYRVRVPRNRVRVPRKPNASYIEMREDQLDAAPAE